MRLTVGPLPSAVYWRRRAVVLGALFIVLIVLFTTCGGPDGSGANKTGATPSPTVGSPEPSPSVLTPDASESATAVPTTPPAAQTDPSTAATSAAAPAAGDGACTDAEIKVTPVPGLTTAPAGQTIIIRLRIKNESDRTCTRDVGPDLQEVYIKQGARTIWSSDKCGPFKGSNPLPFTPNFEREYQATWNGQMSTSCSGANANGGAPKPGQYEVFGRVGTDNSTAVKLTLT
ncbi:hypothetical protein [Micromonospora sp. CPCC 206061]|uniref:hypothetical protein n=1 Tax=Micromonospora sp. CPCC 206061 TaxID=3122410 RepID=UPI002FF37E0C